MEHSKIRITKSSRIGNCCCCMALDKGVGPVCCTVVAERNSGHEIHAFFPFLRHYRYTSCRRINPWLSPCFSSQSRPEGMCEGYYFYVKK